MISGPGPALAFNDWLLEIFTRPVSETDYFLSAEEAPPEITPKEFAGHLAQMLAAPGRVLSPFDDLSVAGGLNWLFDSAEPGMARSLGAQGVPQEVRLEVIRGLSSLFAEVFAARCGPHLGHLSEDGGALGTTCYMFWDRLYIDPTPDPEDWRACLDTMLDTLEAILSLRHAACQEAALHGLGHWHGYGRERAEAIVDKYMEIEEIARPELRAYGKAAKSGCVL